MYNITVNVTCEMIHLVCILNISKTLFLKLYDVLPGASFSKIKGHRKKFIQAHLIQVNVTTAVIKYYAI